MKPEYLKVLQEMYSEGYAIVTWSPEELDGACKDRVMDRSIEFGHELIYDLKSKGEASVEKKGGSCRKV